MIRVLEFKTVYSGSRATDMVLIGPQGEALERTQTWHRIKDLQPPEHWDDERKKSLTFLDMSAKWSVIGPAYQAWKAGTDVPETGTPLEAWSGVTTEQAQVFKQFGIRTVEDVRDMSDSSIAKLPFPQARSLPKLAREFLDSRPVADLQRENDELRERMAAMEEMLSAQMEKPKAKGTKKIEAA